MSGSWEKNPKICLSFVWEQVQKVYPIQSAIGKFWDFISQEPDVFERWNLGCGGLLAFPISRNFLDLEFRLESIYPGWMLFSRWSILYIPRHGTAHHWYRSPATSKINISGTGQHQSLPFWHLVQVNEIGSKSCFRSKSAPLTGLFCEQAWRLTSSRRKTFSNATTMFTESCLKIWEKSFTFEEFQKSIRENGFENIFQIAAY